MISYISMNLLYMVRYLTFKVSVKFTSIVKNILLLFVFSLFLVPLTQILESY